MRPLYAPLCTLSLLCLLSGCSGSHINGLSHFGQLDPSCQRAIEVTESLASVTSTDAIDCLITAERVDDDATRRLTVRVFPEEDWISLAVAARVVAPDGLSEQDDPLLKNRYLDAYRAALTAQTGQGTTPAGFSPILIDRDLPAAQEALAFDATHDALVGLDGGALFQLDTPPADGALALYLISLGYAYFFDPQWGLFIDVSVLPAANLGVLRLDMGARWLSDVKTRFSWVVGLAITGLLTTDRVSGVARCDGETSCEQRHTFAGGEASVGLRIPFNEGQLGLLILLSYVPAYGQRVSSVGIDGTDGFYQGGSLQLLLEL